MYALFVFYSLATPLHRSEALNSTRESPGYSLRREAFWQSRTRRFAFEIPTSLRSFSLSTIEKLCSRMVSYGQQAPRRLACPLLTQF